MKYGYARVSSRNQKDNNSFEVQRDALIREGATEIVFENFTGTTIDRPQFSELIDKLQSGDTLIVTKLDRFARATDAGKLIQRLVANDIKVHVLNMGLMDNTPMGKLLVTMMLGFAEYERDIIVERTQTGIAKKMENEPDWKPGRPTREIPGFQNFFKKQKEGTVTIMEACRALGISKTQWYRLAKSA